MIVEKNILEKLKSYKNLTFSFDGLNLVKICVNGGNSVSLDALDPVKVGYFIGLILGDGCIVARKKESRLIYSVRIAFCSLEDAKKCRALVRGLFDLDAKIYDGSGCYSLVTYSKPLSLLLHFKYQIPIGKKYVKIVVPAEISRAGRSVKIAFLKGVFDSDGNIYKHRGRKAVQLRQKSFKFLIGL